MDKLGTKKKLYAGLGDYARQRRIGDMRKKYSTGSAELDRADEIQDQAIEAAEPPTAKKPAGFSLTIGVGDAGKLKDENDADMGELADDEEMQKWMAKQKG